MSVSIKKAMIKSNLFLSVEYSEQMNDGSNNVKKDCTAPVHDDLKAAFKQLHIHLALLCEQVPQPTAKGMGVVQALGEVAQGMDPDGNFRFPEPVWQVLHKHFCNGFSIGGSGESEGITLIGYRELEAGKVLNLTSPFQKWDGDNRMYSFDSELAEVIENCKNEVHLYLFEGKHQPEAQLDMFEAPEEGM